MSNPILSARGRYARASQMGPPEAAAAAKRELKTMILERDIRAAVDTAPSLSNEQRATLAMLLLGAKS